MSDATTLLVPDGDRPAEIPGIDLLREVGRGGFGQVWLGQNRVTGKLVAVKLIQLQSADAIDRAARELQSLIRFETGLRGQQDHLVTIHHVDKTDQYLYYLMDAADDESGGPATPDPGYRPRTLASAVQAGPLPPEQCLDCARQLLKGLACLHEAGLVHRDVKPSNCLFLSGMLRLADVGLLTHSSGSVSRIGTLIYMPPDGRMDARADVYAAGLVIYEMFAGLAPESFPRWSAPALERRDDPALRALNRLVLQACRPDPAERFQDAGEMLAALEESLAEPPAPRPRAERRTLVLAALCVLAALAVAAAIWARAPGRADINFITRPFEAEIHLDGQRRDRPDGTPYTTPCTIPDLPRRPHAVVFKRRGFPDLPAGTIDFGGQREVDVRWDKELAAP